MASNSKEAKIKFTAETGEFNKAINKAEDNLKVLRSELKLNETQMKNTGTSVEGLEKSQKLLTAQLENAQDKTEALRGKLDKAIEIYGEGSSVVANYKRAVANAQIEEEKITRKISECTAQLKQQADAADDTRTATDKLTDKMEAQQTELTQLKKRYSDLVIEGKQTSDEAKTLAREIKELSSELRDNQEAFDKATEKADKYDKSLEDTQDTAKGDGFTVMKGALSNLVSDGIQLATEAIKEFARETLQIGQDFTYTMSGVQAISGATGEELEDLREKAKELGADTVFSATTVADAMTEMAKAGWSSEQIMDGMSGVLDAASASGEDLGNVATIVADAITGFGLSAADSTRVADLMTQAANAGTIGINDLGESFKYIAPIAGATGYNIEDVTTAISAMSMAGIKGSQAGTSLRTMLANLAKPTEKMEIAMDKLGISIIDSKGEMKPLKQLLDEMRGSFENLTTAEKEKYAATLAGKEGMSGLLSILNLTQEEYDAISNSMYNCNGVARETSAIMQDNLSGDLEELNGGLETVQINLFEAFEPALRSATSALQSVVDVLQKHPKLLQAVATTVGILAGAVSALATGWGIYTAAQWLANTAILGCPLSWLLGAIVAVAAVIAVFVTYWDEITAAVKKCWEAIKSTLSKWGTWIDANVIQPVKKFFVNLWDGIKEKATNLWTSVKTAWANFKTWIDTTIIQPLKKWFSNLWDGIVTALKKAWEAIKSIWDTICNVVQVAIMFIGSLMSAAFQIITLPFRFIWENCKEYVFTAWEWIKNAISTAINAVKNTISTVMNAIKTVFTTVWHAIKSVVTTVWNAIKNFITPIVNSIKSVITTAWNAIKSAVQTAMNAVKSVVSTAWNAVKSAVTNAVNAVKTKVTSVWNSIKSATTSAFNSVKSTATNAWNSLKNSISNAVNSAKSKVSSVWSSIKTSTSNAFNSIKSKATNTWNNIKSAITKPIETAKSKLKSMVDTIKGYFNNLKIKLPHIKMPHFKITGSFSLDPPKVPKLSVDWYAKAMGTPMILNSATIFGQANGRLLGGGEAGSEMIGGVNTVMRMIQSAVDRSIRTFDISSLVASFNALANRPIVLKVNGREIALATASDTDSVHGLRNSFAGRGLVLE